MSKKLIEAYNFIIHHEDLVVCMDCDSTVITSSCASDGSVITTGEGLSDVAIALGKRIGKPDLYKQVDAIAQETMSKTGAIFSDSLDARLQILIANGLTKTDITAGAEKAELADGFIEYIQVMCYLEENIHKSYKKFFFLSGGFYEMLIHAISKSMDSQEAASRIFSNYFLYEGEKVIGWDRAKSKMFTEDAKKNQVESLRKLGLIDGDIKVSGLGDGSNDISMSDPGLFIAYTGTSRREQVVQKAYGVEVENFFEALVLHTSPKDREYIMNFAPQTLKDILIQGKNMLEKRVNGLTIALEK